MSIARGQGGLSSQCSVMDTKLETQTQSVAAQPLEEAAIFEPHVGLGVAQDKQVVLMQKRNPGFVGRRRNLVRVVQMHNRNPSLVENCSYGCSLTTLEKVNPVEWQIVKCDGLYAKESTVVTSAFEVGAQRSGHVDTFSYRGFDSLPDELLRKIYAYFLYVTRNSLWCRSRSNFQNIPAYRNLFWAGKFKYCICRLLPNNGAHLCSMFSLCSNVFSVKIRTHIDISDKLIGFVALKKGAPVEKYSDSLIAIGGRLFCTKRMMYVALESAGIYVWHYRSDIKAIKTRMMIDFNALRTAVTQLIADSEPLHPISVPPVAGRTLL